MSDHLKLGARQGIFHGSSSGSHTRGLREQKDIAVAHGHGFSGDHEQSCILATLAELRLRGSRGTGSFAGMFLSVNLAAAVIPVGSNITGLAAGAYQAEYMACTLWSGFWFLALLNDFWILFSTHLANTDALVRTITDILWMQKSWSQTSRRPNVRRLYYQTLLIYTIWGIIAMGLAPPLTLFKIMGNVAAAIMVIGGTHLLLVNRKFLPLPLRPAPWRQMMIILCILFYAFLAMKSLLSLFSS